MNMKIKMKKAVRIATDGIGHVTRDLAVDEVVTDLRDKLAQDFVDCDFAELVVEEKKVTTSPENKAIKSAPDNKVSDITEGKVKKGGVNKKPTRSRPDGHPSGQGGKG
jgi:hypothetical protein